MTQPELFEELQTASLSPRRRADKPVFATRRLSWSATYPQLALAGAVGILVFVGTFALGIEQGKRLNRAMAPSVATNPPRVSALAVAHPMSPPAAAGPPSYPRIGTQALSVNAPALVMSRPASSPTITPPAPRQYTVQLATYTHRAEAERQLAPLKRAGYSAYLNEGNQRVALCVGLYPARATATKQLPTFRKKFRDCFVRLR